MDNKYIALYLTNLSNCDYDDKIVLKNTPKNVELINELRKELSTLEIGDYDALQSILETYDEKFEYSDCAFVEEIRYWR